MVKIRAKFKKEGDLIYISHLDLMRLFQRAFRRGNIPIKYSEGYNPHPKLSFAMALPVGVASSGEYLDVELKEMMDIDTFIFQMNKVLPEGVEIIQGGYVEEKISLMALMDWSSYMIEFYLKDRISKKEIEDYINEIMERDTILITKEKRKKNRIIKKEVNIRGFIKELAPLIIEGNRVVLKTTLRTGSRGNLKPLVIVDILNEYTNIEIKKDSERIQRLELFAEREGHLVAPIE